ncbi:MAG: class I SAM-dependent methyltransferase [Holophagales bacterium]|nr:MAG: class I SAM-dependent methyltransferase [Holophagales bacterium]
MTCPLETVPCALCGRPPQSGDHNFAFGPHRVLRCTCGFWYLTPRLAERDMIENYRSVAYFEGRHGVGYSSYLAQEATLRRTFSRLVGELARRGLAGGDLLEVGCAYGFFLDEARGHFRRRVGTDFSAEALARAAPHADALVLGGVAELPVEARFDVAALVHVIEHVYDPVSLVRELHARLRPGGALLLAAPDMDAGWRPLLGRRWPFYKVPEHVSFFSHASLERLLTLGGFATTERFPYLSYFTLELVGEKLGRDLPAFCSRVHLPVPATTAAVLGRKAG